MALIRKAKAEPEAQVLERTKEQEAAQKAREREEQETGKKKRGRKPKGISQADRFFPSRPGQKR